MYFSYFSYSRQSCKAIIETFSRAAAVLVKWTNLALALNIHLSAPCCSSPTRPGAKGQSAVVPGRMNNESLSQKLPTFHRRRLMRLLEYTSELTEHYSTDVFAMFIDE